MQQSYLTFSLKGSLKMMIVKLEEVIILKQTNNTSKVLVFKIGHSGLFSIFSYYV